MSNDPIGYGDGLNMYAYAYNDPVNYRDPLGLSGNATDENETPDVEEIAIEGDRSRVVNSREQSAVGLGLQTGGGGIASAAALGYRMEEEIMVTGTAPDCFSLNSKNSCQTNIFILMSAGNPGGGGGGGNTNARQSAQACANSTGPDPSALEMAVDWAEGIGPDSYVFGNNSRHSNNLRDAFRVNQARDFFLQ